MASEPHVVTAATRLEDVTVFLFRSTNDDALVVQIDTAATGRVRVNINDGAIWDADPEEHHHSFCPCTRRH